MANVVKPTTTNYTNNSNAAEQQQQNNTTQLQRSYIQNTNSSARMSQQAPYNGQTDSGGEYRLRIGIVDNPDIQRDSFVNVNPLDVTNIYNNNTGQITLRWIDMPGGPIRPQSLGGQWTHNQENEKYNPEEREYNDWDISSRREMVSLSSPLMWSDDKNYCGMNYVPPVGSVAIVGFRKHGLPYILGYVPTHSKVCYPVLKPGEMVMKGYGNNYTHWRWSEKMDMKAWSIKDELDVDDSNHFTPAWSKKNDTNCTLWIRINANDRYIKLSAFETDPPPRKQHETHQTEITLMPRSLTITSQEILDAYSPSHTLQKNTKYYQDESEIEMIAADIEPWVTIRHQDMKTIVDTAIDPGGNKSVRYQDSGLIKDTVGATIKTQTSDKYQIDTPEFIVNGGSNSTINSPDIIMNGGSKVSIGTPDMIVNASGDFSVKSGNAIFNNGSFKLNANTTINGNTAISGNATYNGATIVNTSTDKY